MIQKLIRSPLLRRLSRLRGVSRISIAEHLPHNGGLIVIPIADVDKAVINTIRYAKLFAGEIVAVHILLNPPDRSRIEDQWKKHVVDIPLFILDSPNRSVIEPLTEFIDEMRQRHKEGIVTLLLPVIVSSKWWHRFLHNQTARLIERVLQSKSGVVIIRAPFDVTNGARSGNYLK